MNNIRIFGGYVQFNNNNDGNNNSIKQYCNNTKDATPAQIYGNKGNQLIFCESFNHKTSQETIPIQIDT